MSRDEREADGGCAETVAIMVAVWLALTAITLTAGLVAAFWFGLGALLSAIAFLWEAGHNARKRKDAAAAPTAKERAMQ